MKAAQAFMMIFRITPDFENQPTEQEAALVREQWGNFIGTIALKEKLITTHQFGFDGKRITANRQVHDGIALVENQTVGGMMIVRSNSLEEAKEMAKDCPILKMGGTVEIRDIVPMQA